MQQTDLNPPRENAYLSQSFLARVRRAYKIALDTWGSKNSKIWGAIDQRRAPVHAALLAETDADLRDRFANPVSSELFLGVDFLCDSILGQVKKLSVGSAKDIANEGRNLTVFAGHAVKRLDEQGIADHLDEIARTAFLSFTKLIGAENEADDASIDAEKALKLVDRQLDQTVLFPNPFPGELGMVTSRGIASYRAICALYHAWRIRLLLPKCAEKSVIEIGPGLGRTAYYAYRAGVTDYTTVDLPMGIVAQACFLGAALGPEKILLPGDNERIAEGRVKLLVAGDQAYRKYGVVFNSDSMTEMRLRAALQYVKWISRHSEQFLSINHDLNIFTVRQIAPKWLTLEEQCPYPMEQRYTEERFKPRQRLGVTPWHKIAWHISKNFLRRGIYSFHRRIRTILK